MASDGSALSPEVISVKQFLPTKVDTKEAVQPIELNNPQDESAEVGEKGSIFFKYLQSRIDDGVRNASNHGRSLPEGAEVQYSLEIKSAYLEIVDKLGIDESIFSNELNAEAFLALCDSWVANKHTKLPSGSEQLFLMQFGRILAGSNSRFNLESFKKRETGADFYVDDPLADEIQKEKAVFEKCKANVNQGKTIDLESRLRRFGPGNILASVREKLGVLSLDQEKPFNVLVLNTRRENVQEGEQKWTDVVGDEAANFGAFTYFDAQSQVPIMVFSQEEYEGMVSDDPIIKKQAMELIMHEYAHTQRSMGIGKDLNLGRIFDERMVTQASLGTSHADALGVSLLMAQLQPDNLDFRAEFRRCIKSDIDITNFYRLVSDNYGLRSTLLLFATQPISYKDKYGFDQIPGVRFDSNFRISDLMQQIVNERSGIDPLAVDKFLMNLTPQNAEEIRDIFNMIGITHPFQSEVEAKAVDIS